MLTLLFPPRSRYAGGALSAAAGRALARADRAPDGEGGWRAQCLRHFELLPRGWPMAAITRELDAGDAGVHGWLRADPAHVRADLNAGRMLACGDLGLSPEEAEDFLRPLRPLFGDAGFPISAPVPARWYLMLPPEARFPEFSLPEAALGDDLYDHLPHGPEGRRWRALLSEAQVILHNHPRNAGRIAAGQVPVNSLWFWGGGRLPDHVRTAQARVHTVEAELAGLARLAGAVLDTVAPEFSAPTEGDTLVDLRAVRDLALLERAWLQPALTALARGDLERVCLDFADGARFTLEPRQRWRLWRRPLRDLGA